MLPSEILKRAIAMLQTGGTTQLVPTTLPEGIEPKAPGVAKPPVGWCQGAIKDDAFHQSRDHDHQPVRLFKGFADKAILNPDAVQFTAYAAIVKVLADRDTHPEQLDLMWNTLFDMALAEPSVVHLGGAGNYAHPLIAFNEVPGRQADEVINFLDAVADYLKGVELNPKAAAEAVAERTYAQVPPKHGPKPKAAVAPAPAKPRAKRSKVVRNSPPAKKARKPPVRHKTKRGKGKR
jgi:hypothetical protein